MTDTGRFNKEFIWNPNNCECECDKLCDVGDYLDYKSCKCRKKLVDILAGKCDGNIDGKKMIYNDYEKYAILVQYTL